MTTPSSNSVRTRMLSRLAAVQKLAEAAKKTAKQAKAGYKAAKKKFKDAKRAAKKHRKEIKALKAELATLVTKKKRAAKSTPRPTSRLKPLTVAPVATEYQPQEAPAVSAVVGEGQPPAQ